MGALVVSYHLFPVLDPLSLLLSSPLLSSPLLSFALPPQLVT